MKKKRSNSMAKARIQPFCTANNKYLGYFDCEIDRLQRQIMLYNYTIIAFV